MAGLILLVIFGFPMWVYIDARRFNKKGVLNHPALIGIVFGLNPALFLLAFFSNFACWDTCSDFVNDLFLAPFIIFAIELIAYVILRLRWNSALQKPGSSEG